MKFNITNRTIAIILGIGIVIFPINFVFEPCLWLGLVPSNLGVGLMVLSLILAFTKGLIKKEHLGSKWVWIPMLVIVASLCARIAVEPTNTSIAGAIVGVMFFGVYLCTRALGTTVLKPFLYTTILVVVFQVIAGIINTGGKDGGLITNYCASAGYTFLGFVACRVKWQKWLMIIVGIGLFFTGAAEAIFAVFCLGIIVLIRRDWSRWLLVVILIMALVIGISFVTGFGNEVFRHAGKNIDALGQVISGESSQSLVATLFTGRWLPIERAFARITPLGHGLNLTAYTIDTIHNVPLIIVDQIGIAGAIAWTIVTFYCLIKTKWKYLWASVLILSVFDHFTWTQLAPLWWCFAGLSTSVAIKNDYIFRKDKC